LRVAVELADQLREPADELGDRRFLVVDRDDERILGRGPGRHARIIEPRAYRYPFRPSTAFRFNDRACVVSPRPRSFLSCCPSPPPGAGTRARRLRTTRWRAAARPARRSSRAPAVRPATRWRLRERRARSALTS